MFPESVFHDDDLVASQIATLRTEKLMRKRTTRMAKKEKPNTKKRAKGQS
jgi:hypothetical protein